MSFKLSILPNLLPAMAQSWRTGSPFPVPALPGDTDTHEAASNLGHTRHCHCHSSQSSPSCCSRAPLPNLALRSRQNPHVISKDIFIFKQPVAAAGTCKTSFFCCGFFPWQVTQSSCGCRCPADSCIRKEHIWSAASRRLLCQCSYPGLGLSQGWSSLGALGQPSSLQPLPNPWQGQCCPALISIPWGGGLAAASLPGQAWPLAAGLSCRGDSGREPCEGPGTNLSWSTAYSLLPLPSSPFLTPFPQGPNSQLCCSINIITIIILSLDT